LVIKQENETKSVLFIQISKHVDRSQSRSRIALLLWIHQNDASPCDAKSCPETRPRYGHLIGTLRLVLGNGETSDHKNKHGITFPLDYIRTSRFMAHTLS
jgi:hypothetical protein